MSGSFRAPTRVAQEEPDDDRTPAWDGFTKKKVDAKGPFDVIIVGSGISGLSCAAMLARAGKRVLVLERHDRVGGTMHTFQLSQKVGDKTWKWEFDSGVHYVAAPLRHSKLFESLTASQPVDFVPMSDDFDCATLTDNLLPPGQSTALAASLVEGSDPVTPQYGRRSNREEELEALCARFPDQADGLRKFYRECDKSAVNVGPPTMLLKLLPMWLARALERQLEGVYRQKSNTGGTLSTTDMFRQCGLDPNSDVAGMLTYQWPDFGIPPEEQPFFLYATKVAYHCKGTYYPRGGGNVLAQALAKGVVEAGGTIMVRAAVDEILVSTDDVKVRGVRVKGEDVLAPVVISAAGAYTTLIRMLPDDGVVIPTLQARSPDYTELCGMLRRGDEQPVGKGDEAQGKAASDAEKDALPLSRTWVSLFCGLDSTDRDLKLPNRNLFIFPSWKHNENVKVAEQSSVHETPLSAVFITSSSAKDDSWAKRKTTGNKAAACVNILGVVDWASFEKFKGKASGVGTSPVPKELRTEYEELKRSLTERLLYVLYQNYPGLKGHVIFTSLGTPLTMNWYIGAVRGEFSGLDHGHARWSGRVQRLLRPQTPIEGLFLTGQDVTKQSLYYAMVSSVYTVFAVSPWAWFRVLPLLIQDAIVTRNPCLYGAVGLMLLVVAGLGLAATLVAPFLQRAPQCLVT